MTYGHFFYEENPKRKGTDKRTFLKRLQGGLKQSLESTETDEPAPIKLEVNCVLINKRLPGEYSHTRPHGISKGLVHMTGASRTQALCKVWTGNYCLLLFQEDI